MGYKRIAANQKASYLISFFDQDTMHSVALINGNRITDIRTAVSSVVAVNALACYEVIKQNPQLIKYVKNQTEDLCLMSVQQNGDTLQFIHEPTHEIILTAVKNEGLALRYVLFQKAEICLVAII